MAYPSKTNPDAILRAALELLESQGYAALSMRSLAQQLNLKAPSLYRHFKDKEALESAMIAEGAQELLLLLQRATQGFSPQASLPTIATNYVSFAKEKPELYQLLMSRLQPPTPDSPAKNLWNFLLDIVSAITRKPDDTAAAVALWSFLHGYTSLELSGMFGPSGPKGAMDLGLHALQSGLSSTQTRVC